MEFLVNNIECVKEYFIFGKQQSSDKNDIKINVKIVFDNPELKNLHFTGNMDRYGNLAPILKSISMIVGLRIEIKNKTIYIYQ